MPFPTLRRLATALFALAVASSAGCNISLVGSTDPYARCTITSFDDCSFGTECIAANITTDPSMSTVGAHCSNTCFTSGACPSFGSGTSVCVTQAGAASGQCYQSCNSGSCPSGFTCSTTTDGALVCAPNAGTGVITTPTCGDNGQACCTAGFQCNSTSLTCGADGRCALSAYTLCSGTSINAACAVTGTTCLPANTTNDPAMLYGGTFCTAGCATSSDCPADPNGSVCVTQSYRSGGQCYRACTAGTCPTGFTCSAANTGGATFCVPDASSFTVDNSTCGVANHTCCGGNTCYEIGTTCGPDALCSRIPYTGCPASEFDTACRSGASTSSTSVITRCIRPTAATSGNGVCTSVCNGDNNECPVVSGYLSECLAFTTNMTRTCAVTCDATGSTACPYGTRCQPTTVGGNTTRSVCLP